MTQPWKRIKQQKFQQCNYESFTEEQKNKISTALNLIVIKVSYASGRNLASNINLKIEMSEDLKALFQHEFGLC
jgi:predicted rRNA methylase YqxC with S4 and FtsJ domains